MNTLDNKCSVAWNGFVSGDWQAEVNVRDFIQKNYAPYYGDAEFLAGPTSETTALWDIVMGGGSVRKTKPRPRLILIMTPPRPSPLTALATLPRNWRKS